MRDAARIPCQACARHLRAAARACPLCAATRAPHALTVAPETPRAVPRALVAALGAPRTTARDRRAVLASLLAAPGEYRIELRLDGRPVARRSVTVVP